MKNILFVSFLLTLMCCSCTRDTKPPIGIGNKIEVKSNEISAITADSATVSGSVESDLGDAITERGFVWSVQTNPTTSSSKIIVGSGKGSFISKIGKLNSVTRYYVRAYAVSDQGIHYGNQISFVTISSIPIVSTTSISTITRNTANSGGNVTSSGGASVVQKGVCWSTAINPTTSNSRTVDGSGIGAFTSTLTGLNPNTTYYVRAYAINSLGTGYGNSIQFRTLAAQIPSVSTTSPTSITQISASSGGFVSNDGGAIVTQRGICWSTFQNPTISNSRTSDGSGVGTFSSSVNGLTAGTTYYVRAYATNSVGTAYGSQQVFTTLSPQLATVTITSISSITQTTASVGGNVTSDGGAAVTQRGVCWSTFSNPTISNARTITGSGIGSYSSFLSGLTRNTLYYVRAYATNAAGTSYGVEVSFRTLP